MKHHSSTLAALLAPLAFLLLAACELPPPGPRPEAPTRVTATLLTDGTGVTHNGRRAVNGARFRSGDRVVTGFRGAALIRFSDRTTVQIVEAPDPVYVSWRGDTVTIRMDNALVDFIEGAVIGAAEVIGNLASVFNDSRFATEEDRARFFRHDLFTGRAELIRPQPGRQIAPGQYARVTPDGRVQIGRTSPSRREELRRRFGRWDFAQVELPRMPNLLKRSYAEARRLISANGLRLGRVSGPQTGDSLVVAQEPRAGRQVEEGTRVDLDLRGTVQPTRVPDLIKRSYAEARRLISASELRLGSVSGPQTQESYVVSQKPRPRAQVRPETRVDLVLEAPQQVTRVRVPRVINMKLDAATRALRVAGLRVGRVQEAQGGDTSVVMRQYPPPDRRVPPGSRVDLVMQPVIE